MGSQEDTSRQVPSKISTSIWADVPNKKGKESTLCHGFDFYNDLLGRYSWNDLFFLLLKGELPSKNEAVILNIVMSSIINPGPKDWATVAAMTASVSQTTVGNSLIAGISALQGRYNGGLCVEQSMEMLGKGLDIYKKDKNIPALVDRLESKYPDLPGYGLNYADRDQRAIRLVELVKMENIKWENLDLALQIEEEVAKRKKIWLTTPGAVSAILCDLKFSSQDGHGLYIVSSLPGVLAHIIEQMKKGSWNSFPFYDTPKYTPEKINDLDDEHKAYGGNDA
jgi:citrate synthase